MFYTDEKDILIDICNNLNLHIPKVDVIGFSDTNDQSKMNVEIANESNKIAMDKNYENNDSHNDVDHQTVNGKNMFILVYCENPFCSPYLSSPCWK